MRSAVDIADFRTAEDPEIIPEGWLWERITIWRDGELSASDWTQLPDTPVDAGVWAAYRQALRDITGAPSPQDVIFPTPPA